MSFVNQSTTGMERRREREIPIAESESLQQFVWICPHSITSSIVYPSFTCMYVPVEEPTGLYSSVLPVCRLNKYQFHNSNTRSHPSSTARYLRATRTGNIIMKRHVRERGGGGTRFICASIIAKLWHNTRRYTRRGPANQPNAVVCRVRLAWHVEIQFNLFLKSLGTRAAQGQHVYEDKDVPVLHK